MEFTGSIVTFVVMFGLALFIVWLRENHRAEVRRLKSDVRVAKDIQARAEREALNLATENSLLRKKLSAAYPTRPPPMDHRPAEVYRRTGRTDAAQRRAETGRRREDEPMSRASGLPDPLLFPDVYTARPTARTEPDVPPFRTGGSDLDGSRGSGFQTGGSDAGSSFSTGGSDSGGSSGE
jgi:uncharacterized membrane protein YgcG